MTLIRDMTPRSGPRLIEEEIPECPFYFRKEETYALQSPLTEHQLSCTATPWDPKPTPAEDFVKPDYSGLRKFDPSIGCYVREPRRPDPIMRRPRPSPEIWGDTEGDFYWAVDRETGHDMRRFRAQTASRAQTIAALYAVSNRLPASAAYARPDQ